MDPKREFSKANSPEDSFNGAGSSSAGWNFKPRFFDHFVNAMLIFAGVFLAFWLNDFRLKQIQDNDTARAMELVITEMENNLAILERWAPYHLMMLERLEDLFIKDSIQHIPFFDLSVLVDDYRGIMREILTNHSMELAKAQNIHFDLESRMDIIMVYEQQKFVENALNRLIEMTYERAVMDPEKTKENFGMFFVMLGDLYGQEEAMIRNYRYRLERLKGRIR